MTAAILPVGVRGAKVRLVPDDRYLGELQSLVANAREKLFRLVADFDRPERAYLAQPHAGAPPRFSDYARLARVEEWALAEEAEAE